MLFLFLFYRFWFSFFDFAIFQKSDFQNNTPERYLSPKTQNGGGEFTVG